MKYRREIDGLRALAVLPVVFFHAGFELFSGGFVGVDVFFVISGYLITSIILLEKNAGAFSLAGFYERRARRILPALFFVMFACIPFAWMWLSPPDMKDFAQSLIAVALFSSNFLFWQEIGYFETAAEMKPLLHTWSLAVEEQFYVIFPMLIMALWRLGRKPMLAVLSAIAVISLGLAHWGSSHAPAATFFLLPARGWELLLGAFIAFYHMSPAHQAALASGLSVRRLRGDQVCSVLGLGLITYAIFAFDDNTPFPSLYALIPTMGTGLIILFAHSHTWVGRVLSHRIVVGIGLISYSAYLWHQPLFAFARHQNLAQPSAAVYLALIAVTFILAYLTWRFVEQPFRRKQRFSRQQIFTFATACSAVVLSLGATGHLTNGFFDQRITTHQRRILATVTASPKRNECHMYEGTYIAPKDACEYFGGAIDTAVVGDSHAVEIAYATAKVLRPHGRGVKHFSASGCPPVYGRMDPDVPCSQWLHDVVAYINRNPQIRHVVVTYRIHAALFGNHEDVYPDQPDEVGEKERQQIWKSYTDLLYAFKAAGKNVVLVLQAPEISASPTALIMRQYDLYDNLFGIEYAWWKERAAFVRANLGSVSKDIAVIRPADYFCDGKTCYSVMNGRALYFDDDHMSLWGAEIVARQVYTRIKNQADATVPMDRNFSRRN